VGGGSEGGCVCRGGEELWVRGKGVWNRLGSFFGFFCCV